MSEGVIIKKTDYALNIAQIKAALQSQFPSYMLPKAFILLKKIPLTLNGKIDNAALPEPNFNIDSNIINIDTSTKEEKQLIILWQTILGIQ